MIEIILITINNERRKTRKNFEERNVNKINGKKSILDERILFLERKKNFLSKKKIQKVKDGKEKFFLFKVSVRDCRDGHCSSTD